MKKQWVLVFGASVLTLLSGCGGGSDAASDAAADTTAQSTSAEAAVASNDVPAAADPAPSGADTAPAASDTPAAASGSDAAAVAVEKYVGTWRLCNVRAGGGSAGSTISVSANSVSIAAFTSEESTFTTPDCTGAPASSETNIGTFTIVGTKTIAGQVVDKIRLSFPPDSIAQVFLIANGQLFIGLDEDDGGTRDSEGFHNALEATGAVKQ